MIILTCQACNLDFQRKTSQHNSNLKRGRKLIACSRDCLTILQTKPKVEYHCEECNTIFSRKKSNKDFCRFCSTSCSAKYTTRIRFKDYVSTAKSYVKKPKSINTTTLQDLKDKYSISQYHAKIRGWSRQVYKDSGRPLCCYNCGYDLHVDICHIQDVKSFPMTTLVSVVNAPDNLIALDKRCHWEFDNGYLELSPV